MAMAGAAPGSEQDGPLYDREPDELDAQQAFARFGLKKSELSLVQARDVTARVHHCTRRLKLYKVCRWFSAHRSSYDLVWQHLQLCAVQLADLEDVARQLGHVKLEPGGRVLSRTLSSLRTKRWSGAFLGCCALSGSSS